MVFLFLYPGKEAESMKRSLPQYFILILGVLLITGMLLAVGFLGIQKGWFSSREVVSANTSAPDIDPGSDKWNGSTSQASAEDSDAATITIPGYPSLYIPAGQTDVAVAFVNPEENPCYFQYDLVLQETGEVLYSSKLIPPGEAITRATLSRALQSGEYSAVLQISTSSLETLEALNGANVLTMLEVK